MAKMDFKAVIDLVKYTLTLGAACFAYTLEKLVPAPSDGAKWFVLVLLSLFVFSVLGGIFIFSAATAALHDEERAEGQQPLIKKASYIHLGCLAIGVLLLGGRLVENVLTEAPPKQANAAKQ
jgi:hypothetical protein